MNYKQDKSAKPTRPRNSYNFFFVDQRRAIQQEFKHVRISYGDVSRLVAARWKRVDKDEKAYYEQLAAKDKRRFALEMLEWSLQKETSAYSRSEASSGSRRTEGEPRGSPSHIIPECHNSCLTDPGLTGNIGGTNVFARHERLKPRRFGARQIPSQEDNLFDPIELSNDDVKYLFACFEKEDIRFLEEIFEIRKY